MPDLTHTWVWRKPMLSSRACPSRSIVLDESKLLMCSWAFFWYLLNYLTIFTVQSSEKTFGLEGPPVCSFWYIWMLHTVNPGYFFVTVDKCAVYCMRGCSIVVVMQQASNKLQCAYVWFQYWWTNRMSLASSCSCETKKKCHFASALWTSLLGYLFVNIQAHTCLRAYPAYPVQSTSPCDPWVGTSVCNVHTHGHSWWLPFFFTFRVIFVNVWKSLKSSFQIRLSALLLVGGECKEFEYRQ